MFDAPAEPSSQSAPAETSARERMGILRRISEVGLRMAERLDRRSELAAARAEAPLPEEIRTEEGKLLRETASAFAQVARAVSLSIALEDRIERGPPTGAAAFGPELVCAVPRESRLTARRTEVETRVRRAIDLACRFEPARIDRLCDRLYDLIDRETVAVDRFLTRPAEEVISDLCRRLGIDPELAAPEAGPAPALSPLGDVSAKPTKGAPAASAPPAARPRLAAGHSP